MNKTNLIPFKHILISREGEIYWYIDENVIESKHHKDILYDKCNMISLCTDCNRIFDEEWEGNLLAKEVNMVVWKPEKKILYLFMKL